MPALAITKMSSPKTECDLCQLASANSKAGTLHITFCCVFVYDFVWLGKVTSVGQGKSFALPGASSKMSC